MFYFATYLFDIDSIIILLHKIIKMMLSCKRQYSAEMPEACNYGCITKKNDLMPIHTGVVMDSNLWVYDSSSLKWIYVFEGLVTDFWVTWPYWTRIHCSIIYNIKYPAFILNWMVYILHVLKQFQALLVVI